MQQLGWQLLKTENAGLCKPLKGSDSCVDRLLTGEGGKGQPENLELPSDHTDFLSMHFPSNITSGNDTKPVSISFM